MHIPNSYSVFKSLNVAEIFMLWFQVSATILPLLTFISKKNSPLKHISYTKENKGTYLAAREI